MIQDFRYIQYKAGTLTVGVTPPVPIGDWDIRFQVTKRFGGASGLIQKYYSSGYNGASGITIVDSGAGIFNIGLKSVDTSGLMWGNYAYTAERRNSGVEGTISLGTLILLPGGGP
jgi:hypothetical protein